MQIANTIASKAIVAAVAAAMIFSAFAAPAKAATAEELQKMINDLMAQMAALGGSTTPAASSASVCPYTWTRDLKTGATGADVMKLQQFLNANADTRVAATGAGSAGMETQTYGPATAAAVSKFQVMHRADILTPAGLTNPTGFFGPSTRAKANALCVTSTGGDEDEDDEDTESGDLQGEADLKDASLDDASDDEVEEGAEDAEIAEFNVEFQDGDASISRIDVTLDSQDTSDAWDALDEVSLWVDGDEVARMSASDEDDYQDDEMTIRFSGLDIVAMEDEELTVVVGATFQGNIDAADQDTYLVTIDSMRFFDADGVASTENDPAAPDQASFDIVAAGAEDEVIVKTSSEDPEATTLQVEDDAKSDWYTVFAFDLDTDDSTNDIDVNTVVVSVDTGAEASYNTLVDDAELVIDGVTIDDVDVTGASTTDGGVATLTFDVDGDVTIDAGDRVGAELKLRFKSLALADEGVTVLASVNGTDVDAEGADDVTGSGAATGDAHTLRSTGVNVALDSTSAAVTTTDGNDNDYATYKVSLDVTAFEQDVYVPINAASTTWKLVDGNGADLTVPSASTTVVVDSSADEGGAGNAFFQINEGETETVSITVTYSPGTASPITARLQLMSIVFDETGTVAGTNDSTWSALPANEYRTSVVTIQN